MDQLTPMTWEQAETMGLHKYVAITRRCRHGHAPWRYVKNDGCVACVSAAAKRCREKKRLPPTSGLKIEYHHIAVKLKDTRDIPQLLAFVDALNLQRSFENGDMGN